MDMFLFFVMVMIPLSLIYVKQIDYMKDNYPDYKGEDLFDEKRYDARKR